mmetsp:Transcript_10445/g.13823  ORF Transcript_10445/g.13823 Transcript_10445/m.13823 type:complete len:485 (+) Transcript_10445:82-1536(+)
MVPCYLPMGALVLFTLCPVVCGFVPLPLFSLRSAATLISSDENTQICTTNAGCNAIMSRVSSSPLRMAEMDDDEDDDEDDEDDEDEYEDVGPLGRGVDSVAWLPTAAGARDDENPKITKEDSEFLPLFPLGGIVYTPNSEHVLNIFEPRYRQMYTDILMNGSKRFVVSMSHPTESGRFAQMGVLFELEELKEVSEQTEDQIKYICNHKVTGRVKLHRIVNPSAWQSRDTYLRVEGTIIDDSGKDSVKEEKKDEEVPSNDAYDMLAAAASGGVHSKLEKSLQDAFAALVDIQHDLEEDVRFTRPSVATLAVKNGATKAGLWQSIKLWQTFADQRLMAMQNELQLEFQERLQAFLKKERGLKDDELPSAIGFEELSAELQQEVKDLQKRMAVEIQPLVLESTLTMQKILEAEDHPARLKLLKYFIENETNRLSTKRTLKSIFTGIGGSDTLDRVEEPVTKKNAPPSPKPPQPPTSSIFIDEEDAFQ